MKKRIFFVITLLVSLIFSPLVAFAGTQDFVINDFTADYYLEKDAEGVSKMHVVENITATFPNYDQNHGIERAIPTTNQNGQNLVVNSFDASNYTVKRNGVSENFTTYNSNGGIVLRIGNADSYVHGKQTYTIEYDFYRLITEHSGASWSRGSYQELYWDINGTGWSQHFNKVTANIHMSADVLSQYQKENTWCYYGSYGSNTQCADSITQTADGVSFSIENLDPGENMTVDLTFNDSAFVVPPADNQTSAILKSYGKELIIGKNKDGSARVSVSERITASFPSIDTYNGAFYWDIQRASDSKNRFLIDNDTEANLTVHHNMKPVDSTDLSLLDIEDGAKTIAIEGLEDSDGYIHGEHDFVIKYELKNTISDANDFANPGVAEIEDVVQTFLPFFNDRSKQENPYADDLQYFAAGADSVKLNSYSLTEDPYLNIVFEDGVEKELAEPITCLDSGTRSSYCTITKNELGYQINWSHSSTITPYIAFKKGTFKLSAPRKNYSFIVLYTIVFGLITLVAIIKISKAKKDSDKIRNIYKSEFVVPQYEPMPGYTVAEMAEAYTKRTKNPLIATMLELIVKKKIDLMKDTPKVNIFGKEKQQWKVKIQGLDITRSQLDVIKILSVSPNNSVGDEFKLRSTSSSYCTSVARSFPKHVAEELSNKGVLKNRKTKTELHDDNTVSRIVRFFFYAWFALIFSPFILVAIEALGMEIFGGYAVLVGAQYFYPVVLLTVLSIAAIHDYECSLRIYARYTEEGIKLSKYLDGLKLYIKMAEADRIKFLQSVPNADVSHDGIVKLYEKLLPYAALFGLEKSWMETMQEYYNFSDTTTPNWIDAGVTYSVLHSISSSSINHATSYTSSSSGGGGWSSSSSSSGGGGGGSSGGGGGGGGGGGW